MLLVALGQVLKSKDTSYPQQPSPGISERTGCSGPRVASWDLGMLAQQGKRERKQHFKTKQKPNTEREQLRSHFPHHHHNFWKLWYHFCRKSNEVSLLNHHKDDDHIMEVTPQKSHCWMKGRPASKHSSCANSSSTIFRSIILITPGVINDI